MTLFVGFIVIAVGFWIIQSQKKRVETYVPIRVDDESRQIYKRLKKF